VGNAAGIKFEATVIPFLLRGINLLGIDSATCPIDRRLKAWRGIARDLPMDKLETMTRVVSLSDVPAEAERILEGQIRGRTVVDVNA
jgi:acrylyl-CoA reductase (NADPH)